MTFHKPRSAAVPSPFDLAKQRYQDHVDPFFVTALDSLGLALEFTRARGSYIYDRHRNRYLDFIAGHGSALIGHNHPVLLKRLQQALSSSQPALLPLGISPLVAELAHRLCLLAGPPFTRAHFATTGSEAIEHALQVAMTVTGRRKFISSTGGYHGLTLGALGLAPLASPWRRPFPDLSPNAVCMDLSDSRAIQAQLQSGDVAAVVLEVVQGFGGCKEPGVMSDLQRLCSDSGTLIIIDEVLTGLGRTGTWFSFQQVGRDCKPEIVVVSKGLTGGTIPVSVVLMREEVFQAYTDSFDAGVGHHSTFAGNLLAMTAGIACLEVLEKERLPAHALEMGNQLRSGLTELHRSGAGVSDVRGRGLLLAFSTNGPNGPSDVSTAGACWQGLLDRRILTSIAAHAPAYIKLTPPLNITPKEVERFLSGLADVLREIS